MAGIKSYMSAREKAELVKFIAVTGENYDRYIEWCQQRQIKPFTKKYLHTWVQRRRLKVKDARKVHEEEVRKLSMYDKERRIEQLEGDVNILNGQIEKTFDIPELQLKLIEQKRKTMEAIAKERNEWLKPESKETSGAAAADRLGNLAVALLNAKETKTVDGVVVVAED